MRILVVDDQVLFREGIVGLLESQPDLSVVGEAGSVHEAIAKAIDLEPDLILMDIALPDGSGVEAVRMIHAHLPETIIVMLTIHESDELLLDAIQAGAKGFLLKNTPLVKLLASLHGIGRGEAAISRKMTFRVLDEFSRIGKLPAQTDPKLAHLTLRELDVLAELAQKYTNREIAERLSISENTVKIHVHKILAKLNLSNRREAGKFARRYGLGRSPDKQDMHGSFN
jgi:DNA-binding NarL/FixJ family response regulator